MNNPHSKFGPVNLGLEGVELVHLSAHLPNEMLDLAYVPALLLRAKHFISCSPSTAVSPQTISPSPPFPLQTNPFVLYRDIVGVYLHGFRKWLLFLSSSQ